MCRETEKVQTTWTASRVYLAFQFIYHDRLLTKPTGQGLKAPVGHCHRPVGFSDCLGIDLSILEFLLIDLLGLYIFGGQLLSIKVAGELFHHYVFYSSLTFIDCFPWLPGVSVKATVSLALVPRSIRYK